MNEGILYFLVGNKDGFQMSPYGYGGMNDEGLLAFTINPTNGFTAGCGEVHLSAKPEKLELESDSWSVTASSRGVNIGANGNYFKTDSLTNDVNGGITARGGERAEFRVSAYSNNPSITIRSGLGSGSHVEFYAHPATGTIDGVAFTALASLNGVELAFSSSSSRRYKHDIKDLEDEALDPHKLLSLPVRQFEYNDDVPCQYNDMHRITIPGFIAEEVAEIYPSAVIHRDKDGAIESWDERRIIPGMLALIQEQEKRIETLEARLAKIEEMLT
jgi:hypothetical protein